MIQKDLLTRNLHFFLEKLVSLLSGEHTDIGRMETLSIYSNELFGKNREYFINLNITELQIELGEEDFLEKIRLLAEIYFIDSQFRMKSSKLLYATKSLELFNYYNSKIQIYDIEIQKKIEMLSVILKYD